MPWRKLAGDLGICIGLTTLRGADGSDSCVYTSGVTQTWHAALLSARPSHTGWTGLRGLGQTGSEVGLVWGADRGSFA